MKAIFAFSGQGAQAVGMGKDLYENSPEAKKIFDLADEVLGYPLTEIIFNGPQEKLTETRYCQVAIYTMSCAALEAFRAKFPEIQPVAAGGLSLGEYAALYAAGSYTFADGLKLLSKRAELMDAACKATKGGMASVLGGDAAVIAEVAKECGIDVANYNSPGQIVISGEAEKVDAAVAMLKEKGMRKIVPLTVAGAFHSRLMASAGEGLAQVLADAAIELPECPVYHNFTGAPAGSVAELKDALKNQVAGRVHWYQSVEKMVESGADAMIEFGPGNVLTGLLRRTCKDVPGYNINSWESLNNFNN